MNTKPIGLTTLYSSFQIHSIRAKTASDDCHPRPFGYYVNLTKVYYLLSYQFSHCLQLTGAAEFDILAGDELGILSHEDLSRGPQVKVFRLVAEELTVHARPHQAAVGIDVDLGHTQFGGTLELIGVHAFSALQVATGLVDALHFFLRYRTGPVHHQRETGQALLDLFQHIKVQALRASELESAVAGADCAGQRIAAAALDELLGLVGIGQFGIRLRQR